MFIVLARSHYNERRSLIITSRIIFSKLDILCTYVDVIHWCLYCWYLFTRILNNLDARNFFRCRKINIIGRDECLAPKPMKLWRLLKTFPQMAKFSQNPPDNPLRFSIFQTFFEAMANKLDIEKFIIPTTGIRKNCK